MTSTPSPKRNPQLFFTNNNISIIPEIHLKEDVFPKDKSIIHIHNSKTGGTSIAYFMRIVDSKVGVKSYLAYDECDAQPISNVMTKGCIGGLKSIKVISESRDLSTLKNVYIHGHMPLPSKHYFGPDVSYISIIRDPLDRMISLANYLYQKSFIEENEIEDLLLNKEIDNLQTRALAGEDYMAGECTEETFTKAVSNIQETFTIVAPNEAVDDVMALIANHYGVKDVAYSRAAISGLKVITKDNQELCDKIIERNQFDIRLHEYVKIHWETWKEEHIESISDNIHEDKIYKVMSAPFYESGELLYLTLDQMNNFAEQTVDLIGLNQN